MIYYKIFIVFYLKYLAMDICYFEYLKLETSRTMPFL